MNGPGWKRTDGRPLVCAHRGSSERRPENTVAAAEAAIEDGAAWIEFDVRPAADGRLVVHHDPVTADGAVVSQTAADELVGVPDFATFVAACGPLGLDIELKTDRAGVDTDGYVELAASEIDRHLAARTRDDVLVTSFDQAVLDAFRTRCPDVPTGVLFHDRTPSWAVGRAVEHGHSTVVPWFRLVDRHLVAAAHEAGLAVATWTVNEPRHIRSMAAAGVDMIIGDAPARINEVLDELD